MNGPVDVLAVMGSAHAIFDNIRFERRHESTELQTEYWSRRIAEMIAARAAVAELIESCGALLGEWDRQDHGMFDVMPAKDWAAAEARFRAALANVGSAS